MMRWSVDTADAHRLLWAVLDHFEGNALVSFEGRLSDLGLSPISGARSDESSVLRRHTQLPVQDFVVLPVNRETIRDVKRCLSDVELIDESGPVIHVQVQSGDSLVLGAYDNFDPECVVVWPPTPEALLQGLLEAGALRSYNVAA